ncbi:MAG: gliding motility protein GldM [Bacteroidales bacterium]
MGGNSLSDLTPRQRMINMMYLVLTALLALNVSKEVLNAFVTVNKGLVETNKNFRQKTNMLYDQMDLELRLDSAKVIEHYKKTQEAKQIAQDMVDYIENLQNVLIAYVEDGDTTELTTTWEDHEGNEVSGEWREKPLGLLGSRDNYQKPTEILVPKGDQNPEKGYGYKLKMRIEKFKEDMRNLFEKEEVRDRLSLGLSTEDVYSQIEEDHRTWQTYNFYYAILAADVLTLNKIIAEVRNAETDVVNSILSQISVTDFKFDRVEAHVIPESNYVMSGQEYEARILVAAISETQQPEVYILEGTDTASEEKILNEGVKIDDDSAAFDGMTRYMVSPTGLGEKSYTGIVKMRVPGTEDEYNYYPFSSSYIVAEPTAVISATKVNVLYRGVDNPVEVSAAGVATANLSVSASNATIRSAGGGRYNVQPGQGNTTTIRVTARQDDGSTRHMGEMEYRVRNLPDPQLVLAGKNSGEDIRRNELKNSRLFPSMQDALFDVQYRVTRFTLSVTVGQNVQRFNAQGDRLTGEMKNIVDRLPRGANVGFSNITVAGPDGTRPINGIFFTLQ